MGGLIVPASRTIPIHRFRGRNVHCREAIAKKERAVGDIRSPTDVPLQRGVDEPSNQKKLSESHDCFAPGAVASSRHGPPTNECRAAWRPGLRRYRGTAHPGGRQICLAGEADGLSHVRQAGGSLSCR